MAANDPFAYAREISLLTQGRRVRQIATSDTVDLKDVPKALYITGTGNLCVEPVDGYEDSSGSTLTGGVTFAVTAGDTFDKVRVRRIYATGTTATAVAIF